MSPIVTATLGYVFVAGLVASVVYALAGKMALKNPFHWKFGIILMSLFAGLAAMWPVDKKLKRGIDLSGGTILVYELKPESTQKGIKIDDLVTALKKRVNPNGTKDIPIRPLSNNRIELILPNATADDVEEVKRKLTTQGLLQFRILANSRRDDAAIQRALRPENFAKPPNDYRWVKLGELVTGPEDPKDLKVGERTLTDRSQRWDPSHFVGATVQVTGKDAANLEARKTFNVEANTSDTLTLDKPIGLTSVTRYDVLINKSEISNNPAAPNFAIREVPRGKGVVERQILVKEPPERMNVSGDDLAHEYPTEVNLRPAVGFDHLHEAEVGIGPGHFMEAGPRRDSIRARRRHRRPAQ